MPKKVKQAKSQDPKTAFTNAKKRVVCATQEEVFHVLLRVRSENGRTIKDHKEMVTKKKVAFVGKMGAALGEAFIRALNEQIQRGVNTYLFLTTREGWNGPYVTDQCLLRKVHSSLEVKYGDFIPRYYLSQAATIKTWFEVTSLKRLTREEMNRIYVLSSGREIMSVIKSTATTFRVGVREISKSAQRHCCS